jgi:cell division protein FtsI/penicillin-binding protein 2
LWALLEAGKLSASDAYICPHKLSIRGRRFDCSHPSLNQPLRVATAIAYSCNCFVTHFAARFEAGELARFLGAHRLGPPAQISAASQMDDCQLQSIGEERILVTPSALLNAYAQLAARAPAPIIEGLEDAVEFGTAQLAASPKVKIAGKTGTVLNSDGARVVWFAGFAPSRAAEAAVVVAVQGRSGGLDAAPIGGSILADYLAKK